MQNSTATMRQNQILMRTQVSKRKNEDMGLKELQSITMVEVAKVTHS